MSIAAANWESLMAFLACDTQWRVVTSMAGLIWIGLDFAGVEARLRRRRPIKKQILADLSAIEDAALPVLNGGDD